MGVSSLRSTEQRLLEFLCSGGGIKTDVLGGAQKFKQPLFRRSERTNTHNRRPYWNFCAELLDVSRGAMHLSLFFQNRRSETFARPNLPKWDFDRWGRLGWFSKMRFTYEGRVVHAPNFTTPSTNISPTHEPTNQTCLSWVRATAATAASSRPPRAWPPAPPPPPHPPGQSTRRTGRRPSRHSPSPAWRDGR